VRSGPPQRDRVAVLLATWNGARFIDEQLESLAAQTVPWTLYLRDDGSEDDTVARIEAWSLRGNHDLRVVPGGERIGPAASFFSLLAAADAEHRAFAFCDQDDVWLPQRLAAPLARWSDDRPRLAASPVLVCDELLRPIATAKVGARPSFANALVENIAFGCAITLSPAARLLVLERPPVRCHMHDWWCYLVVSAFGETTMLDEPLVRYRQHGGNAVGQRHGLTAWATRALKAAQRDAAQSRLADQAVELLERFGDRLGAEERRLAELLVATRTSVTARMRAAATFRRQTALDSLALRSVLLAGRA
jgi:hypothetical protein